MQRWPPYRATGQARAASGSTVLVLQVAGGGGEGRYLLDAHGRPTLAHKSRSSMSGASIQQEFTITHMWQAPPLHKHVSGQVSFNGMYCDAASSTAVQQYSGELPAGQVAAGSWRPHQT
jgi:hypothetical protein